MLYVL
jgi:Niemann-Pick C1 protein